jgi:hypothetical protein
LELEAMAEVLDRPQFKVLTHQQTGEKTGRVYFPSLYICENKELIQEWMSEAIVYFTQRDVKLYGDGSVRLYFKAPDAEYQRLELEWSY